MGDATKPGFDARTSRHTTGSVRLLAAAPGYRVCDMRCWMGPSDPSRENQFPAFRVSAIIGGSFSIRSNLGEGVAVAGSLLMGNACECYLCRRATAGGDRCINFDFDGVFLENVRVALGARGVRDRFNRLLLPPSWKSVAIAAVIESIDAGDKARALEEAAFEIAAAALTGTHGTNGPGRKTSFRNERAVMKAALYIEANFHQPCALDELAAEAGMSPFHFVRVYRRVICQTPYRHLLVTRLRHAAGSEWRLSPAYDLVPFPAVSVERRDLALTIGDLGRYANVSNLLPQCARFLLTREAAAQIIDEMEAHVRARWYALARRRGYGARLCDDCSRVCL